MKLLSTRRCTWCAVKTSQTIEESKELPIRWGANTSTKVLPPRIRRSIRRVPRYNCSNSRAAASRSALVRVKDNSSQSSAVLWSWHGRQRFQRGLSRLFAFRVAKLLSVHLERNMRLKPAPLRYAQTKPVKADASL